MSSEVEKRRERKDYTDQEIDMGLTALAICSGRRKKAAELVKEQSGVEIPATTIADWARTTYPDRYQRVRAEVAPKLQAQMADTHQALADTAARLEVRAVTKLSDRLDQGDVEDKDLVNLYKASAIAGGIHVEKAQLLNDRPTHIVQRDLGSVLRDIKGSLGIEIEAEVVDEETVASWQLSNRNT